MSLEMAVRRLWMIVIALSILIAMGAIAFHLVERLDPFTALYLTITILSTVGFGDVVPVTPTGRVIYMGLVLVGIGIFGYAVSSIASLMAERSVFKLAKGFFFLGGEEKLKDHIIVVGWNPISRSLSDELRVNGEKVLVIVDRDEEAREASKAGYDALVGSPLEESTYRSARINHAKAVVLTGEDHSGNLMAVLRIRDLNRDIPVVVTCDNDLMKSLFYRAGATRVVNLAGISGRILASYIFEPAVAEVLSDLVEAETGLDVRQVIFRAGGSMSLGDLRRRGLRSPVLMVVRGDERHYYPSDEFEMKPGDLLILAGLREDLDSDERLLSGL